MIEKSAEKRKKFFDGERWKLLEEIKRLRQKKLRNYTQWG